jgi:hypothetical protein
MVHGHMESVACKGLACTCHFGGEAMAIKITRENQGASSSLREKNKGINLDILGGQITLMIVGEIQGSTLFAWDPN